MNKRHVLLALALVFLTSSLQAFISLIEMKADTLRKDPFIKILVRESEGQVSFSLAFREPGEVGSLRLVARDGTEIAKCDLRGEEIRRAFSERLLRKLDWQGFENAEVIKFTVHSNLIERSDFTWRLGPLNDEHGMPRWSGVVYSSALKEIVNAGKE